MINKNQVIDEAIKNICNNCKSCTVAAIDKNTGKKVYVKAMYCLDGSGYIDIDILDENKNYLDTCKLKHHTDACILPFNLEILNNPDCGCIN